MAKRGTSKRTAGESRGSPREAAGRFAQAPPVRGHRAMVPAGAQTGRHRSSLAESPRLAYRLGSDRAAIAGIFMPLSRSSFILRTLSLLLLGLIALAGVVVTNVWLVQRTQDYVTEVTELRRLRAAGVDLRSRLQDAETGQRGFLITDNPDYLQPYNDALANLAGYMNRLAKAAEAMPELHPRIEQLTGIINARLDELRETVDLAQQGQRQAAIEIVGTDRGKDLMDQARLILQEVVTAAEDRLGRLGRAQAESADALWWVSVIGGIIVVAITLAGLLTILSYLRQLAVARQEVEALNVSLEERVRERTAELGRANEEIQRFAYIVTHDLRAPLVNIMGFTAELEQGVTTLQTFVANAGERETGPEYEAARLAAQEDLPEALGFIRSSTRKMDGLINAILKLSREGRRVLKPEPINLSALLESAVAAVAHQVADAAGEVSVDVRVPNLVSDRLALEQIVGNLLDNAVKYRRRDVPLRIKVRATARPGGLVHITIEDNGRGIEARDHERVFELFRRSGQQDQPGEGIGLPHIRAIARNLGGDITLNSTFGQGSVFTLVLPAQLRATTRSMAA
ncbi:signal transduction histidine kinase [Ancylobacter sp. 3268]|uniref:sensor histidine kinase n=1 Tax=Ancylobacter sp. 3268 TaxID=2817752 RepID=UPI002861FEB0|nr:CHASE3 domain-containing protein [Ancylobacter sp. 3268]MDR6950724.1 signal transduction histidine kinase [Ancylobacter sp. 3268]